MNEKSTLTLIDKKVLNITGVNKIISFDPKHFSIDTTIGVLKILGNNLEIEELDSVNKKLFIKGEIDLMSYKTIKEGKENIVKKLFK